MKSHSAWINIDVACEILEISRSAYYEWLSKEDYYLQIAKQKQKLTYQIKYLFYHYKSRYGAKRISDALYKLGVNCNKRRVSQILEENKLFAKGYKNYSVTTTKSNHKYKVFDNLLKRNFAATKPNKVFVGDITYIRTDEGWLYLATVIDLYSRKVIGHSMSNRMTKDLVISALQKALKSRGYPKGVIVHSDRGSQYASNEYKSFLKKHGLVGSMSKKGDCWDNAVAESFFATLKKEYVRHIRFKTRIQAQLGVFDYIEAWYNNERSHSTLNWLSPSEFEYVNRDKFSKNKQIMKNVKNNIIGLSMA
jgi:transposase InsO family protein